MAIDEEDRRQQLEEWLEENVLKIPEPEEVTLYSFEMNWRAWSGNFRVKFDDLELEDTFGLGVEITLFRGSVMMKMAIIDFMSCLMVRRSISISTIKAFTRMEPSRAKVPLLMAIRLVSGDFIMRTVCYRNLEATTERMNAMANGDFVKSLMERLF